MVLSPASKGVEAVAEDRVTGKLIFALSEHEAPGASALVTVSDLDLNPAIIIDNSDSASFNASALFKRYNNQGFLNNVDAAPANSTSQAQWHFGNLVPGQNYQVSATWTQNSNRSKNAPFIVGGTTIVVNQQLLPDSFAADGTQWQILNQVTASATGEIVVQLNSAAVGYVIADAVRIEPAEAPGSIRIIDNKNLANFSASASFIRFENQGFAGNLRYAAGSATTTATAAWTFRDLLPGRYRVSATWSPLPNRATDAPYVINSRTIRVNQKNAPRGLTDAGVDWSDLGYFEVAGNELVVQLGNQANNYVIADAVRIERTDAVVWSIDDGEAGYRTTGAWTHYKGVGAANDVDYSNVPGAVATWTFMGLPAGQYRILATWARHVNRATNAPYAINGGTPILINQRTVDGSSGIELGRVTVTDNESIVVTLSTGGADGYVIANQVQIELLP